MILNNKEVIYRIFQIKTINRSKWPIWIVKEYLNKYNKDKKKKYAQNNN